MENPASETVFDLDGLVYRDTLEFAVRNQDGVETTWRIVLAGPGHPATLASIDARNTAVRRRQLEKEAAERKGRVWTPPLASELNAEFADYFAQRILSWTPVKIGGQLLAHSPENARRLLFEPAFAFVANQIVEKAGALEDFFAKPAKA